MKDQAEQIFTKFLAQSPNLGLNGHSRNVATIAETIASATPDLNPDKAYALGLLHDIGRWPGQVGLDHILIGYHILTKHHFEEAARIALTHTFYEGQDWDVFWYERGLSQEDRQFVMDYLSHIKFDDYDRLIQLADNMATKTKITTVEERFADVLTRHHFDHPEQNLAALKNLKSYFDQKTGTDIYKLLNLT